MKYISGIITITFLLVIVGCQKDRLNGDLSILDGKWQWIKTVNGEFGYVDETISETLILNQKGTYKILIEDRKTEKGRLIFDENPINGFAYDFGVEFERNNILTKKQILTGYCGIKLIGNDTILIGTNLDGHTNHITT